MNTKKNAPTQQTPSQRKTPIVLIILFCMSFAPYPILFLAYLIAAAAAANGLYKFPCLTAFIAIVEFFIMIPIIPVCLGIELLFAMTVIMNKLNIEKKKMRTVILSVMSVFTLISLIAFIILWFRQLT